MFVNNNKLIHSSTKMTPANTMKVTSQADVKANLELRALRNRKYPPLNIGDQVKILRDRAPGEKERVSKWSVEEYNVSQITGAFGQKYYKVGGMGGDYISAEVLKV